MFRVPAVDGFPVMIVAVIPVVVITMLIVSLAVAMTLTVAITPRSGRANSE